MNSVTGILARETINNNDKVNILWTPVDNMIFEKTVQKLGHNLIAFDHLYFGKDCPHIIICNNKFLYYEKCKNISIQFHIPVLLIDHISRPRDVIEDETLTHKYEFPSAYKIALNESIAKSWATSYHKILDNKNDISNLEMWQRVIFQTCKMVFKYYG
jgi:hypothetical protein